MNYQKLIKKIDEYVSDFYHINHNDNLFYHNKNHTADVVKHTAEIGEHYQLDEHDLFIVEAAARFHDLGYFTDMQHHEEQGGMIAEGYLKEHKVTDEDIQLVKNCIMATKMPQSPVTLLEKILCDADLYHLGTPEFFKKDKLMLKEYNALYNKDFSKLDWRRKSISFLEKQHYHTDYCQQLLNAGKLANIEALKNKVIEGDAKLKEEQEAEQKDSEFLGVPTSPKKEKKDRPDKGIETMFRISSGNHQRLSDMADKKAHIMITVNSIILSALISLVLRRLNEYEYLLYPTFILLGVSLAAMTFSILSTRPSIPNGYFTRDQVDAKKVNLLFFGNFYKMTLPDYTYGMVKMMEDKEFLYGSLITDVYNQGVVLGKKYHLLRIAYNVFMYGLIVAVCAFIIAVAFFNKH